ncbi:POSSIBLE TRANSCRIPTIONAL REGULATORY PROTEIN [Actinomycetales bacterium JB111]|nr:POSSIBLE TRANSCRIPTIONAL REGULATORY PROTEIN [Actinomycetales bacterium JB111]
MEKTSGSRGVRARSAGRAKVLDLVRRNPAGVTLVAIVRFTGRHENTVRGHLDALLADGLVTRVRGEARGRGRPPMVWRAADETRTGGYAGLAASLARSISRTAENPRAVAVAAGIEWGRDIATTVDAPAATAVEDAEQFLEQLDYSPVRTDHVLALHTCPLLAAANENQEVVCGVHEGLVRGILTARGHDTDIDLEPFASPGTCVLRVGPPERRPAPAAP